MNIKYPLCHLIASAFLLGASFALAQAKNPVDRMSGEIKFEDSAPEKTTYATTQDRTIAYFVDLQSRIEKLSRGENTGPATELSDAMINHLTAAYLYCAVNLGECPMLLDGILEIDVINARQSRAIVCPTMSRFWKAWVRNDMENRHKYMVKTGFLRTTSEFNANKRPSYIKCEETVEKQIRGEPSDAQYFKQRYGSDSAYNLVAVKVNKLLEDIKRQVPNVFVAVGAQSPGSAKQ